MKSLLSLNDSTFLITYAELCSFLQCDCLMYVVNFIINMQYEYILLSCTGNSAVLLEETRPEMSFFEFFILFSVSRSGVGRGTGRSPWSSVVWQREVALVVFTSGTVLAGIDRGNAYIKKNALSHTISC